MAGLSYRGVSIPRADWGFPGYGPTVLRVRVTPQVLDFQAQLGTAVVPFVDAGGTAGAFVADPGEVVSLTVIDWVEAYVPNQIGDGKYSLHLTVGVDSFDHLKIIEAEPLDAFEVHPWSVAVYRLGNNGTARKLLNAWPPKRVAVLGS